MFFINLRVNSCNFFVHFKLGNFFMFFRHFSNVFQMFLAKSEIITKFIDSGHLAVENSEKE